MSAFREILIKRLWRHGALSIPASTWKYRSSVPPRDSAGVRDRPR